MLTRPSAYPTPSLRRRMACLLYESLLLFGLLLVPALVGTLVTMIRGQQHDRALGVLTFLVYGFYFVGFWSRTGQTLAMKTWKIQLLTVRGEPLSRRLALLRYIACYAWVAPAALLGWLNSWSIKQSLLGLGVGFVVYAMLTWLHPQRQFWHDAICGTRLVPWEAPVDTKQI